MIAFSTFLARAVESAFAEGEAENLVTPHRRRLVNALIQLQTYIHCLRDNHTNHYFPSDLVEVCGLSKFTGPRGVVESVYSFLPGSESCRPLSHRQVSNDYIQCVRSAPCGSDMRLPYDDETNSTERDLCYEGADKFFSIGPAQTWAVAPRLPAAYVLVVHWSGIKRSWADDDLITDDEDVLDAASKYLRSEAARYDDGDLVLAADIHKEYRMSASELYHRCREETRLRKPHVCLGGPDDITGFFQPVYPPDQDVVPPPIIVE